MPEKSSAGGWRKRIHSRPNAAKLNHEERALVDADAESLRPPSDRSSWRSTFHSRPGTPIRAPTPTVLPTDADDFRRDNTPDIPSPRKPTKPKLARYISGYLSIKDASKESDFAEPWVEMPPPYTEYVDPLVSLQSVFSHMTSNPARPIPLHLNSGIFRIFEDYRKVREEKERLEILLHETFEAYRSAEEFHDNTEIEYQAEIRRLEILIARGTSGMAGLAKARRESTMKKPRAQGKNYPYDDAQRSIEAVPAGELDEQIRMRSQQVLLQRPVSPSSRMAILSRQLQNAHFMGDFMVGTPPVQGNATLSRNAQSELDLSRLGAQCRDGLISRSVESGFSGNGDPLPDEIEPLPVMVEPTADLEALVALQELGSLVARKKGLDTNTFLTGLMHLYSSVPKDSDYANIYTRHCEELTASPPESREDTAEAPPTPDQNVRPAPSYERLRSTQGCRRQYSFEPGDDQVAALERKLRVHGMEMSSSSDDDEDSGEQMVHSLRGPSYTPEKHKPSKIPSPLQRSGLENFRRESSISSAITSVRRTDTDDRRDSRSSVLTAFRHNSSGSLRPVTQSRSSSAHTSRHSEGHSSCSTGSLKVGHNVVAIAAARAIDHADTSMLQDNAPQFTLLASSSGSSARIGRPSRSAQTENALPH